MLNQVIVATKVARLAYRLLSAVTLIGFFVSERKLYKSRRLR